MTDGPKNKILEQAKTLARENQEAEPGIKKVLWFPDDREVHLVEIEDTVAPSLSGDVEPFYFDSSPQDELPAPSGIAIIRSDELGKLRLPEGWGNWDDARELELAK